MLGGMATPVAQYVSSIKRMTNYFANWLPNRPVAVGDVCVMDGLTFKQVTTLDAIGIKCRIRKGNRRIDFAHSSESGVALQSKVSGEFEGTVGEGKIEVEFSKQGGFVFRAIDCTIDDMEDRESVGRSILAAHRRGSWNTEWLLIDTLVSARKTTVLISHSASAKIELLASTPSGLDVARLDGGLSVTAQRGEITTFLAVGGLTPMFGVSRLTRTIVDALVGNPWQFAGDNKQIDSGAGALESLRLEDTDWEELSAGAEPGQQRNN